ncbi:MAG: hypothetical protein ACFB5Z_05845 [Elainellaceae cyanobacterium]
MARSTVGTGTWMLKGNQKTYEIYQGQPAELQKEGLRVRVTGRVRSDVMTLAMIGPVLEVQQVETL